MKIFKIAMIVHLSFIISFCNAQEKRQGTADNSIGNAKENFIIGNYMVVPKKNEICTYTQIGGVDWDGYEYRKDPKINYTTTTLLSIGDCIFFKEYFPFDFNLSKLKIIYRDKFYFLCKDDNNIYYTSPQIYPTKIDISDYEPITDFIYKSRSGTLFFLDIKHYKLASIDIDIDENSVKHLAGNYFSDKNGLYFFGAHIKKNERGYYDTFIKKSEKLVDVQNAIPFVSKKYIKFDNQIYAINDNKINKLNIDTGKLIEVNMYSESFITDGKTIYSDLNYGYDEDNRNERGYFGIWYPALFSGINLEKIYSPLLHFVKENNSIVFNKNNPNHFPGFIAKIDDETYLLSDKKKYKIDKLLFYHPENQNIDVFDEKYLTIYNAERLIQYKKVLYFDGRPVDTSLLDMENLREIKNSNYLTDGKAVFYIGNIQGHGVIKINGVEYVKFDDRIMENTFTKDLKPINCDLLSDGITIVSRRQKVKIKDLNLNIEIVK